jgi:hypothetical protein
MDGEKAVLPWFEYQRTPGKSLFYGDTTIRKGRREVPMDHLLGSGWNMNSVAEV